MKRTGNLWDTLTGFPHLLACARKARLRKSSRDNVRRFHFDLERHLLRLQDELRDGSYRPGPYTVFRIADPTPRLICAAPYRDRIVHHALCGVLEPIWERSFIHDSYACRGGKGTHAAVDRYCSFARTRLYALKCDVSKYFASIDHALLVELLAGKVKDRRVLDLAGQIIAHSPPQDDLAALFPEDPLWQQPRRRGLPLGNQTSQFFANVYLDPFDHFVKETLRERAYLRYVDDFVVLGNDTEVLAEVR
jgi:hypothetical protein